jgi:UDP-glucuronate 4-epimerase
MKILITGAAGFIGSHLSERLKDAGHDVVGLDCYTSYYERVLKDLNAQDLAKKGIEILDLDLSKDDLTNAVKDVEVVYHFAAQPGISDKAPFEDYLNNNIIATHRLLESVVDSPTLKYFVNTATSSIYGKNATLSEEKPPEPASHYGTTKLAAEQMVLARYRDNGFPACSLRLYSVYGERERPEKLFPRVYRSIFTDYEFPFFEGSEHHLRSYTYIADIIDGFEAVLDHMDECAGEVINIGLDKAITTGEALEIVEKVMGKPVKYKRVPKRAGDQDKTQAVIDKARKLLNYNPSTTPEEGFKKAGDWYEAKILPLIKAGKL